MQEQAKEVAGKITSLSTLVAAGAVVGENLGEKALFKGFPQAFGIAITDKDGNLNIKPAKLEAGKWVPQTADDSKPFVFRQLSRLGIAAIAFAVGMTSKNDAVAAGANVTGIVALAHLGQDLIPALRGG